MRDLADRTRHAKAVVECEIGNIFRPTNRLAGLQRIDYELIANLCLRRRVCDGNSPKQFL
jgi:hypothetical protein